MGRLGFNLSQQQVVVLHQALDADGNHEISLDEFTQVGVYQLYVYMPLKLVMFQAVIAEDEKYLAQNVPGKSKEIDTANEAKDAWSIVAYFLKRGKQNIRALKRNPQPFWDCLLTCSFSES